MWNLIPWKKDNAGSQTLMADPIEREFSRLRSDFDSLVSRMWNDFPGFGRDVGNRWGVEIEETDSHYIAHVPAPGFEAAEFDVSVMGNHLVVKAEHKESQGEGGSSSFRYGKVQHMLPLPKGVQAEQVEACYRNGVLDLKMPKGEAPPAKRIEVKANEAGN